MIGSFQLPSTSGGQSSGGANGHADVHASKRYNESPSEDELLEKKKRAARAATLPEEDKGLVYWEDWCNENELDITPTLETVMLYVKEFVAPLEEKMDIVSSHHPNVSRLCGIRDFLVPLVRLVERNSQNPLGEPSSATSVRPTASWKEKGKEAMRSTDLSTTPTPPLVESSIGYIQDRSQNPPTASSLLATSHPPRSQQRTAVPTATKVIATPAKTANLASKRSSGSNDQSDHPRFKASEFLEPPVTGKGKVAFVGRPSNPTAATIYRLNPKVVTVLDVLEEWRFGFQGGPSIQSLYQKFGSKWKFLADGFKFSSRASIVKEYVRLVGEEGLSDEQAILELEHARNGHSITTFYQSLVAQRRAPGTENQPKENRQQSGRSEPKSSTRSTAANGTLQRAQLPAIKKRKRVSHANDTSAYEGPLRILTSRSRSAVHQVVFPFPVHNLNSVPDVWKEWTEGWGDEPAIEHLVEIHGPAWEQKDFSAEYFPTFHNNSRLVRLIREAVLKGEVGSHEEAIEALEQARKSEPLMKFCGNRAYNRVLSSWGFDTRRKT